MTSSPRVPMVAGNWKMNTTVPEGLELAVELRRELSTSGVEVALLPPFTHLWPLKDILAGSGMALGAQDVFWEDSGAYTGEISPTALAGWCDFVLIGHSERRHLLGETDEQVNRKLRRALGHDLRVILAVGETEAERDAGDTPAVIERQLRSAFEGLSSDGLDLCVLAYEPVWAIGTGRTATIGQAQEVCAAARELIAARFGGDGATRLRILYGGSVTPANAAELFAAPDIDGGLVGGASLRPDHFTAIVRAAADHATR
ncbi:MAG: triose-phosphate isomerase [Candidatus Dormibacteria bacterium]